MAHTRAPNIRTRPRGLQLLLWFALLATSLSDRPEECSNDCSEEVVEDQSLLQAGQQALQYHHHGKAGLDAEQRHHRSMLHANDQRVRNVGNFLGLFGYIPDYGRIINSCNLFHVAAKVPGLSTVFASMEVPQVQMDVRPTKPPLPQGAPKRSTRATTASVAVGVYFACFALILFRVLYVIIWPSAEDMVAPRCDDLEQMAWDRGVLYWLSLSWVGHWTARWGHSLNDHETKIQVEELGPVVAKKDRCRARHREFNAMWQAEVLNRGKKASLIQTMLRYAGYRTLFKIAAWTGLYEVSMYLLPPIAVDWVLNFFDALYQDQARGKPTSDFELTWGSLLIMVMFTSLPVGMAVGSTISTMLTLRFSVQMYSALVSTVYTKSQRMPMIALEERDEENAKTTAKEALGSNVNGSSKGPRVTEEEEAQRTLEMQLLEEANEDEEGYVVPKKFNLTQLVENDLHQNIMVVPLALARLLIMFPVVLVLFALLITKLKLALFFSLGSSFVTFFCATIIVVYCFAFMMQYNYHLGRRLSYFQEVMFSIRAVKSCGWTEFVLEKVLSFRELEVKSLKKYWFISGIMYAVIQQYGTAITFFSLLGYVLIYHEMDTANIFVMMAMLASFKGAAQLLLMTIPMLVNFKPAVKRIEAYLKLPEAPMYVGCGRTMKLPAWVRTDQGSLALPGAPCSISAIRLQGSFAFERDADPVLRNLDLVVPPGALVAVVGCVGAGKTTLLHAILGELHPCADSRLERPSKVGYSAQVPYIAEGTMKSNILYGDTMDDERFKNVIWASGLTPDLEVLPGGVEVPIGSRGIILSGGQRARVSMARATYCRGAGAIVFDDPFGAVDQHTADHIMNKLICGAVMCGRTRIVVMQPDAGRICRCDFVVVVADGCVVAQGLPSAVMPSRAFQDLLSSYTIEEDLDTQTTSSNITSMPQRPQSTTCQPPKESQKLEEESAGIKALREEEAEGRPTWETLAFFFRTGWWRNIISCVIGFIFQIIFELTTNLALARWSSDGVLAAAGMPERMRSPSYYLWNFTFNWIGAIVSFAICWNGGKEFSLTLSSTLHNIIATKLLYAPIDWFYDKTPVGRIMNRMGVDLVRVDTTLSLKITEGLSYLFRATIPIIFIHIVIPPLFTLVCLPYYFFIFLVIKRFWYTLVPLRYCGSLCKSTANDFLTDVTYSAVSVRSFQNFEAAAEDAFLALDNQIKVDMATNSIMERWVCNRLWLMMGVFVTALALIGLWLPNVLELGMISLCINNMFTLILSIQQYVSGIGNTQLEFVSMNRLEEYASLPAEREPATNVDKKYRSFSVRIARADLPPLKVRRDDSGRVQICQSRTTTTPVCPEAWVVVLEQTDGMESLLPATGFNLSDLAPTNDELLTTSPWHRISGVNSSMMNAADMAEELCKGDSGEVLLNIQSGWLAEGACIAINDLTTGYADFPRNVIQSMNLTVERNTKVGVVGATGCGKSSLLLCLLRIIEPRGGTVTIEGVDTQALSPHTLRQVLGLVPQDPVVFTGTIRENLDPTNFCTDARIWQALEDVQLEDVITAFKDGLYHQLSADGQTLSFGQRQLLCIARMILRQPMVLLLDEATSAIDPHTQEFVSNSIQNQFPHATLIAIAHRLDTVLKFDMIVVMDKGYIVEKGSVNELARAKDGIFASMLSVMKKKDEVLFSRGDQQPPS